MSAIKNTLENVYNRVRKALNKITLTGKRPEPKLAWQPVKQRTNMRGAD